MGYSQMPSVAAATLQAMRQRERLNQNKHTERQIKHRERETAAEGGLVGSIVAVASTAAAAAASESPGDSQGRLYSACTARWRLTDTARVLLVARRLSTVAETTTVPQTATMKLI